MFSGKRNAMETANPDSLRQLNLLKLRQVRVLRSEIADEENAEQRFFEAKDVPVVELEALRRQSHLLEDELTRKRFYLKEQQLLAVESSVKEKAATSNKKAARLAERLVKEKAKVELKYEHHLLKHINELKRQLLDAKLRNVQYEFIKVEQLNYYFEKVMRAQKDQLQKLQAALLEHQAVDLAEAGEAMLIFEPQPEIGTDRLDQASKVLKNEIKALSRSARREKREIDRLLEQLRAALDAEADSTNEQIENSAAEEACQSLVETLEEKVFQLEEARQRTSDLSETLLEQKEQFSSLSAAKANLENDLPSLARPTHQDLVSAEQAVKVQGLKMVELSEEKKLLAWQNTHLQKQLMEENLRLQPSSDAVCESAFQIETAKEEVKTLRRNLDLLRTSEAKLLDHQSLQLKNLEESKCLKRQEGARLERKKELHQRHSAALKRIKEALVEMKEAHQAAVARSQVLQDKKLRAEQKLAALEKEMEATLVSFREEAAQGVALLQQLQQQQRNLDATN